MKLTLFYLEHCPYCKTARFALEELMEEQPAYRSIPIEWIEESKVTELEGNYSYYYVPTIYCGGRKVYEASPGDDYAVIRNHVKSALDAALAGA